MIMSPARFHAPPPALLASHNVCDAAPDTSTRFNFPALKKAMERLSGDQNGISAPSVRGSDCAKKEFIWLKYRSGSPVSSKALKSSSRPSGERAKDGS